MLRHVREAYWLKQLDGELPVLELPADNARPAVRSFAGDHVSFSLDAYTSSGLYKIARDNGCTLYMVLLAAYSTLLARLSGQEDIIIGSPIFSIRCCRFSETRIPAFKA
ncbi:condensation domain-containing protein [Bacillus paralicheniformis]|nr:condensation domain-containing protein [Bacillus paralicheniformis]UWS61988.1 condensation domain-containing protein [Bacillus paralicheniformis]